MKTQLDKRDIITLVILVGIFFSIAIWNLGSTSIPTTSTKLSAGQSFSIDLGNQSNIGNFYLLIKDGNYSLTISTGSPGNWQVVTNSSTSYTYYHWKYIKVGKVTRYLKVDFNNYTIGKIAEIGVLSTSNQKLQILSIVSEGSEIADIQNLIDEQNKVTLPVTYMQDTYFDERYFVRTAEQYLHLQSPSEWTHPPLGKLIQAVGIVTVGYSPFGWRLMGVIFATLMIPVIYLIGKRLFGTWIGSFTPAFLLTFDFMHFTMGRMGTSDTYVVFFLLLSQLFFLIYIMEVVKKGWSTPVLSLFLAVIFFILSFSIKWIAIFTASGMLALLVTIRLKDISKLKDGIAQKFAAFFDRPFLQLLGFIVIAAGIYFTIYIPDMLTGRPFYYGDRSVVNLQLAMFKYHSYDVISTTHPFSSAWWSWPILISNQGYVPLWLGVWNLPDSVRSTIAVLGNPAIWWVGFACIFYVTYIAIRSKDIAAQYISIVFLFSWLPYMFIARLTFIYHFYIAVPLLMLAETYVINRYWHRKWGKIGTITLFAAVVVLFGIYYDVISGTPAPASWLDRLRILPSWNF